MRVNEEKVLKEEELLGIIDACPSAMDKAIIALMASVPIRFRDVRTLHVSDLLCFDLPSCGIEPFAISPPDTDEKFFLPRLAIRTLLDMGLPKDGILFRKDMVFKAPKIDDDKPALLSERYFVSRFQLGAKDHPKVSPTQLYNTALVRQLAMLYQYTDI